MSILSFLTEIVCLHFVRDKLFPSERDCSFVPFLKINSFHSKICSSVLLSKINSFLFGVCPSVLRQISTPSFLGFARLYFS